MINYVYFSKKSWSCVFPPFTFSRIHCFRIFGPLLYVFGKKGHIFKVSRFSVFALLFVKLMQHIWFGIYQLYRQQIYWANFVQKLKTVRASIWYLNSNMQNSMVLTFVFDQKSFLGKTQNCQFKLKFDT